MSSILPYLGPRIIIELDKQRIENEENDLDKEKQGNVEILPPGPVEQIGRIATATSQVRRVTFTMVGNLGHISITCVVLLWRLDAV